MSSKYSQPLLKYLSWLICAVAYWNSEFFRLFLSLFAAQVLSHADISDEIIVIFPNN